MAARGPECGGLPRLVRDFGASLVSGGFDTNLNVGRVAGRWSLVGSLLAGVRRVRHESQRGSGRSLRAESCTPCRAIERKYAIERMGGQSITAAMK